MGCLTIIIKRSRSFLSELRSWFFPRRSEAELTTFWRVSDWAAEFRVLGQTCLAAERELTANLVVPVGNAPTNEQSNLMIRASAQFSPASDFFRRSLSEIDRTISALPLWINMAEEISAGNNVDQLALARMSDEQAFRLRRLLEVLVTLFHCDVAPDPLQYVAHFSRYSDYVHCLRESDEITRSFGGAAVGFAPMIDRFRQRKFNEIDALEASGAVNPALCRYLAQPRRINDPQYAHNAGRIFATTSAQLNALLASPANTNIEQLEHALLGFTYNGLFGKTSSEVHFSAISLIPFFVEIMGFCANTTLAALLSGCVLVRMFKFLGSPANLASCASLHARLNANSPPMYLATAGTPIGDVGDLLMVRDHSTGAAGWHEIIQPPHVHAPVPGQAGAGYVSYVVDGAGLPNPVLVPAKAVLFFVKAASIPDTLTTLGANPPAITAISQASLSDVLDAANSHNGLRLGSALMEL